MSQSFHIKECGGAKKKTQKSVDDEDKKERQ